MTERTSWHELRNELGVDRAHHAYEAARLAVESGTDLRGAPDAVDRGTHTRVTADPWGTFVPSWWPSRTSGGDTVGVLTRRGVPDA